MKVIVCGSLSAAGEITAIKKKLEDRGDEVEIPEGVKKPQLRPRKRADSSEKGNVKIKYDLIRGYYKKIKKHDVVLIVNPPIKSIDGYIGGNTLIEMAFAHVLNKKLYCLYPLPKMAYSSEIIALQPIVINGDLSKIKSNHGSQK